MAGAAQKANRRLGLHLAWSESRDDKNQARSRSIPAGTLKEVLEHKEDVMVL